MVHVHRPGGSQILTAARILPLLLAAALLPACGSGSSRDDVHVAVHNQGAEPVRVRVEARHFGDDDVDEIIVAAESSAQFSYDNVEKIEVAVWRTSDDFLLFLDSWDEDDLRREHDTVSVTVTP